MSTSTSKEEPKRLTPTKATIRQLFALSGNLCAFPDCVHLLIDADGEFIAQVAHIEGAEEGGERFNPKMTNEQRRHPENLVLLCYKHHKKTNDVEAWTVERMRKMKADHEQRFQNPEKAILEGLKDWTQSDELIPPKNLDAMHKQSDSPYLNSDNQDEKKVYLSEVQKYLETYKNVPHDTRIFLGAVVERMLTVEDNGLMKIGIHKTTIPAEDLRTALNMSRAKLRRSYEALERYGLGGLDEGFDGEHFISIRHVYVAPFWIEVAQYCKAVGQHFRTYYMDLNFSGLDA
ncbi:hypothetical protein HDE76_000536 [Rhodanobacter sp. ANJX3]|uniref:hypothetical protein n=1 Tax=unclassified Rhodanobacter TaxID=2621553 RepID=UPI0015CD9913|nr:MULTISPECIES: hypothetical protein [unclassified Rhodanobacter]MBB5357354.1 hypothetical protein [Rhodanobacter sp. ANJX3]NYE27401.1 hypothetical protein [Rhodanobacter sp. K2T2]